MFKDTVEIEKNIRLEPEKYRQLLAQIAEDVDAPGHETIAARLELNGILSIEILRTLHEISNTLHEMNQNSRECNSTLQALNDKI